MNFEPSDDQKMIVESFARVLDEHSNMACVRAALPSGFDRALWHEVAAMGALAMRVPESAAGLGLGLFDAALLMEEVGRTLASAPIAEAMVSARIIADLISHNTQGDGTLSALLPQAMAGEKIVVLALHDITDQPIQWVPGALVADHILARDGGRILLITPSTLADADHENMGGTPAACLDLAAQPAVPLTEGAQAVSALMRGVEEWKLLTAAALNGLAREAVKLGATYASEREQFGQLIGTYQAISHPLADLIVAVEGGRFLLWKTIVNISNGTAEAGAEIPLTLWWNANVAGRAVAQSLHSFGGYGLTTEYDIHLYNLRAKALPLAYGDPADLLTEGARRLYHGAHCDLPDVGPVTIDFNYGEEAEALATEVRAFFNATLTPELRAKAHYSFDGHDPDVHQKLAEARLLFPSWPAERGGRNASAYATDASRAVWEEFGWTSHAAGTTGMVGTILARFGSDDVKANILSKIIAGEAICSLGFSEPSSGSDVFAAKTRATAVDGGWRIDGQKMWTSGANIADYVLLLTRTDPDAAKHRGLTMFIVPLKDEKIDIHPVHTFQDERTNVTFYDGVMIPDSYRLGEVNGGIMVMAASLEMEHGASFVRSQQHMLHEAETYCRTAMRSGTAMINDVAVAARLARVYTHNLLTEVIHNRSLWNAAEKKGLPAAGSMSKLFSSESFLKDSADLLDLTAPESLKTNGAAAYINLSYRHAQGTTIYGGTSEVHRSMIAERALSMPRTRA